jgi:hypothetical protein
MLETWKRDAERAAARDSHTEVDEARELVADIESTCEALVNFRKERQASDPVFEWSFEPSGEASLAKEWHEKTRAHLRHMNERLADYEAEIAPLVTDALVRAEQLLGPLDPVLLEAKEAAEVAGVNYLAMGALGRRLQALATVLELR